MHVYFITHWHYIYRSKSKPKTKFKFEITVYRVVSVFELRSHEFASFHYILTISHVFCIQSFLSWGWKCSGLQCKVIVLYFYHIPILLYG